MADNKLRLIPMLSAHGVLCGSQPDVGELVGYSRVILAVCRITNARHRPAGISLIIGDSYSPADDSMLVAANDDYAAGTDGLCRNAGPRFYAERSSTVAVDRDKL